MLHTLLIALAAIILVCLSPEVASQQCRSGVTDEVKQSVREQLRQYQSGGNNGTFPTVAVNCGQVCMSILSPQLKNLRPPYRNVWEQERIDVKL